MSGKETVALGLYWVILCLMTGWVLADAVRAVMG